MSRARAQLCPTCRGTGNIKTIISEEICLHCLGHGSVLTFGSSKKCDKCGGCGKIKIPPIVIVNACNMCHGRGSITY